MTISSFSKATTWLRSLAMVCTLFVKMVFVGALVAYHSAKNRLTNSLKRTWKRLTATGEPLSCDECGALTFEREDSEAWEAPRYNCTECGTVHTCTDGVDWSAATDT